MTLPAQSSSNQLFAAGQLPVALFFTSSGNAVDLSPSTHQTSNNIATIDSGKPSALGRGSGVKPLASGGLSLTFSGGGPDGGPVFDAKSNTWYDVVGDQANLVIMNFQPGSTVLWKMSAGGAELNQSYTLTNISSTGTTTPFPTDGVNGNNSTFTLNWDAQTGNHTVEAIVTVAGVPETVSVSCNVLQPTVNSFTNTQTANTFGVAGVGEDQLIGFKQYGVDPAAFGDSFTASVTTANIADNGAIPPNEKFAVLQLVNINLTYINLQDKGTRVSGAFVLDNLPGGTAPTGLFVGGYISNAYPGNNLSPIKLPEPTGPQPVDSPGMRRCTSAWTDAPPNPTTTFTESYKFQSYLVASTPNGAWVALSEIDWAVSGNAVYKGPLPNNGGKIGDYTDLANWSVTAPVPSQGGTVSGMNVNRFISWTTDQDLILIIG